MFSLMWSEHCAYKHSKLLLRTLPTEGPELVLGPGRERRRGRRRRRAVVRLQGRVPQPPERGRAVPGRGDRRRRHPARRLRGRRAADRDPRLAALRRAVLAALALPARARGRRHRPLRQLDRRRDRRRRDLLRGPVRAELPRQRDVPRPDRDRAADPLGGRRRRQQARAVRRADRPRRDRRRVGAGLARSSARPTRPSARPSRSATRSRRRSCSSARSSCSTAGCSSRCRTSAPPGLTSSSSEMASKGEVGIDIDVSRVPLREADMEPFEIMVSESQERMLCVVEPARVDAVLAVCAKWEVNGDRRSARSPTRARCACSTATRSSASMPVVALVDDCPRLRPRAAGADRRRCTRRRRARSTATASHDVLLGAARLAPTSPRAAGRSRSTTGSCGSRTVRRPEAADAAVLVLDPPRRPAPGIAVSIDGNGRRVACDPYRGAVEAVLECAANLACAGAEPLGLTNCLNFGNPEKPHIAWQLDARRRRHRRRLPRARRAGRRRQRLALQRGRRRPDLPDAGRRHGRRAARRRARRAPRLRRRRRRDRGPARGGWAPSLAGSELAKLRGEALPDRAARGRPRRAARAARRGPPRRPLRRAALAPTTSPRAASRSRSPSAASPSGRGARSTSRGGASARRAAAVRRGPGRVRRLRRPARR